MAITNVEDFYAVDDNHQKNETLEKLDDVTQVDNSVSVTSDDLYDMFEKGGFSGSSANYDSNTGLWYVTYRGKTTTMTDSEYKEWIRQHDNGLTDLASSMRNMAFRATGSTNPTNSNSDQVNISQITESSEKLGEDTADVVSAIVAPEVKTAVKDLIKTKGTEPSLVGNEYKNDAPSVAKVTDKSEGGVIKTPDPVRKTYDEVRNSIDTKLRSRNPDYGSKTDKTKYKAVKNNGPESDTPGLISENDVAQHAFDVRLKENLTRLIDVDTSELAKDYGKDISDQIKNISVSITDTAVDTVNDIGQNFVDTVAELVTFAYEDSWMDPTVRAAESVVTQVLGYTEEAANQALSEVRGILSTLNTIEDRTIRALTTEPLAAANQLLQDKVMDPLHNRIDDLKTALNDGADDLLNRLPWRTLANGEVKVEAQRDKSINKLKNTFSQVNSKYEDVVYDVEYDNKFIPDYMKDNWKYLRNNHRFVTTYDWLIQIVKHGDNVKLPDLNSLLGISSSDYLPIINYNLIEAGLDQMTIPTLNNTLNIPQGYRRPSKLTITLPDIYYSESETDYRQYRSYLRRFKDEYINFIKVNDNTSLKSFKYSLVTKDYRDCCYELTLYRFPYTHEFKSESLKDHSFKKTYLGVPEVSITESGGEGKQLVTDTLTFNIVGEL